MTHVYQLHIILKRGMFGKDHSEFVADMKHIDPLTSKAFLDGSNDYFVSATRCGLLGRNWHIVCNIADLLTKEQLRWLADKDYCIKRVWLELNDETDLFLHIPRLFNSKKDA